MINNYDIVLNCINITGVISLGRVLDLDQLKVELESIVEQPELIHDEPIHDGPSQTNLSNKQLAYYVNIIRDGGNDKDVVNPSFVNCNAY